MKEAKALKELREPSEPEPELVEGRGSQCQDPLPSTAKTSAKGIMRIPNSHVELRGSEDGDLCTQLPNATGNRTDWTC